MRRLASNPFISTIALFALLIAVFGVAAAERLGHDMPAAVHTGLFLLLIPVCALAALHWRRIDEAAREAHKWAWYWGGSFGMAAGFALVVLLGRTAPTLGGLLPADAPAMAMMAMGAMILMLSQLLGLFVAWAFWWWRAR